MKARAVNNNYNVDIVYYKTKQNMWENSDLEDRPEDPPPLGALSLHYADEVGMGVFFR